MNKVPNWREQIVAEVPETDRHYITFQMPRDLVLLLVTAAHARGLSRLAYVRRAVFSWVAYDLGIDYYDMMRDEMKVPLGKVGRAYIEKTGGHGNGNWVITETTGDGDS